MNNLKESISQLVSKDENAISLIQITDTHILTEGGESFNDYDTTESLRQVINRIKTKETEADLILVTGDLVHEPTKSAYQKLADILIDLTMPLFCLPGNHDEPELMAYVMGANGVDANKLIEIGNWTIIMLNTNAGGGHEGTLSKSELNFLNESLEYFKGNNCLIALHHHPISINSSWMDAMSLNNGNDFFEIIDQYDYVKGVIWGHIHQEFEQIRNNVHLLGTPSTCLQFKPGCDEFAVDKKTPAYRKINLNDKGNIKTKVIYI
ncbi:MAG: 3',5'-cyclic-AMP phosphodiesterase [Proteobacteria bacterium]|nr:3',5'-cyclic-AMP phosphodiesterase [Pseudomonadota bacterium]